MGNQKNIGALVYPVEFCIRTKADAAYFLTKIVTPGTGLTIRDRNCPQKVYIIERATDSSAACIAHESRNKDIFQPDFMYSGQDAIDMAYAARRSINSQIFRKENF